jgi:cell division protein FtsA
MSWLVGRKDAQTRRSGIVTVLDVGSSKVCCVVAKLKPREEGQLLKGRTHQARVIGIGHQKSQGVKSGVVIDLDRAEHAIRLAVDAAERMAGLTVDSLIVNLTAGRLKSRSFSATINLGGHEVDAADIKRVLAAGSKQALKAEREVVHSLPVAFSLDAERGMRDPRGMVGDTLGVDMHVLTGDAAPLRNLELCINRSHLSVERMVATPYASGLAALVDDELEMGAACIDMGGGTTTISVFADGKFVHGDASPVGGTHVTMAMAKGL